jgi:hypothetical protein
MVFDPRAHLIQLPRKEKDRATGQWVTRLDDYLEVRWRVLWFRQDHPHGLIISEEVRIDLDKGYARYRAVVVDSAGGKAIAHGTETAADFPDFAERAETRAIGRALALMGYGTAHVGQDLTEGDHVADAPVASTNGQAVTLVTSPTEEVETDVPDVPTPPNGNNVLPTHIPTDLKLPCGGALIADLRPAQLALLVGKVGLKTLTDKTLEPLHVALLAERAARLQAGRRPTLVTGEGDGHAP